MHHQRVLHTRDLAPQEGLFPSDPVSFHVRDDAEVSVKHPRPKHSSCLKFYYHWINPWVRMLLIVPVLYVYSIVLSVATYRNLLFQSQVENVPRPAITHPLYNLDRQSSPFILPDLLFDVIRPSPFPSLEYVRWKAFIDSSPGFWCVLVLVFFLAQRNIIRITEFLGIHIYLYIIQGLLKAFTNYPAASGVDESCYNKDHTVMGTWVVMNFSVDYCGDQMFSGHTSETLVAMILVRRMIWDYVGWGFARTAEQEARNYDTIAQQAHEIKLARTRIDNSTYAEGNTCMWFHSRDVNSAPPWVQKHRTLVWIVLSVLRFLMWFWFFLFMYALLHNRQHYSADIIVAVAMMLLLCTNGTILVATVRWFYRPDFWNYKKEGFFPRVYLKQPLTEEQLDYERRLTRVGRGGLL